MNKNTFVDICKSRCNGRHCKVCALKILADKWDDSKSHNQLKDLIDHIIIKGQSGRKFPCLQGINVTFYKNFLTENHTALQTEPAGVVMQRALNHKTEVQIMQEAYEQACANQNIEEIIKQWFKRFASPQLKQELFT